MSRIQPEGMSLKDWAFELVKELGPISSRDLAEEMGKDPLNASSYLTQLGNDGRVTRTDDGWITMESLKDRVENGPTIPALRERKAPDLSVSKTGGADRTDKPKRKYSKRAQPEVDESEEAVTAEISDQLWQALNDYMPICTDEKAKAMWNAYVQFSPAE